AGNVRQSDAVNLDVQRLSYVLLICADRFFFSSRRRHTRSVSAFLLNRSSDLDQERDYIMVTLHEVITFLVSMQISISSLQTHNRSEERRVGKECRCRGSVQQERKTMRQVVVARKT